MTHSLSILQSAKKENVHSNPFPYLILPSCLPEPIYLELEKTYPSDQMICGLDQWRRPTPGENKRVDISADAILRHQQNLPPIWVDFVRYHTSREFYFEVLSIFGDAIHQHFPNLESRIGRLNQLETGVRFNEQTDHHPLSLDCQVGINTPGTSTSVVIGPHCDSPDELYAGLLYFRRAEDTTAGGDLDIYSWKDPNQKLFRDGHKVADLSLLKLETTIPYTANTLVMFINTLDSVHGVTPRHPSTVSRRLVNIIGEVYNSIPGGLYERPQVPQELASPSPHSLGALKRRAKDKLLALKTRLLGNSSDP